MAKVKSTKQVALDQIQPHPENYNHGDAGAISVSLDELGQYRAIVVSEATGNILAGNHTYLARQMNGDPKMLVHFLVNDDGGPLTAEEERRILVGDNGLARLAYSDDDLLSELLINLAATEAGLSSTGYDADDLDQMLADLEGHKGLDAVPPPIPDTPITETGDVWQLGPHTLVCGDATDREAWKLDRPFDLLWSDPPYGVSYVDIVAKKVASGITQGSHRHIANDSLTPEETYALWEQSLTAARSHATDKAAFYLTCPSGDLLHGLIGAVLNAGWKFKHLLVWDKGRIVVGRSDYQYRHEAIMYGWNESHLWYGDRTQTSIMEIPNPTKSPDHPTMKPIALIEPMIENSTAVGGLVADPFSGSGSTLIACHNTHRVCHAVEIDPTYCDVIVARYEEATGEQGVRL